MYISIHARFKKIFLTKIRPISRTVGYKGKFFISYFVDPPLDLITSKIQLGILSTSFWSWTEGIPRHASKIAFWVQKLPSTVDLLHKLCNNQSYKSSIGLRSGENTGSSRSLIFCSNKYFVIDALWIAAFSCWKIHSSPYKQCPFCAREII